MPYPRKTLTELRAEVYADIDGALEGSQSLLRHSNLHILGAAQAGAVNGLYGYLDYIARQSVPYTAEGENLIAWAALKGVVQKPPGAAHGPVPLTGAPDSLILEGTRIVRADGASFSLTGDVTLDGAGLGTGQVTADVPGLAGNTPAGSVLALASPIAGVNSTITLVSPIDGATDIESLPALRTRMLEAYAAPARAGTPADYIRWAKQVPAVTRAWAKRNGMGAGTVLVWFMEDIARAGFGGFPQGDDGVATDEERATSATGDQLIVADYIFPLQPVPALVFAASPLQNLLVFTIAGLAGSSTATRNLIAQAIRDVLYDQGEPGGLVELSFITGALSAIPAATGYVITGITASAGTINPSGDGNITSDSGCLPVLSSVTYT
jgi:uncharacterized phage protein gp47/JayE